MKNVEDESDLGLFSSVDSFNDYEAHKPELIPEEILKKNSVKIKNLQAEVIKYSEVRKLRPKIVC